MCRDISRPAEQVPVNFSIHQDIHSDNDVTSRFKLRPVCQTLQQVSRLLPTAATLCYRFVPSKEPNAACNWRLSLYLMPVLCNRMYLFAQTVSRRTLSAKARIQSRSIPRGINPLTPNDLFMSRIAPLTSKRCILYIYSTNIGTEYFKHALYSPFFFLFKMQFVSQC